MKLLYTDILELLVCTDYLEENCRYQEASYIREIQGDDSNYGFDDFDRYYESLVSEVEDQVDEEDVGDGTGYGYSGLSSGDGYGTGLDETFGYEGGGWGFGVDMVVTYHNQG